jgi:hypothetical protein
MIRTDDEGEPTSADAATADGSAASESCDQGDAGQDGEADVAKRRSKNRVNARRSRERKRLMLDTLQQEHWQLHQENKRIRMDNDKLREAIETIRALQGGNSLQQQSIYCNNNNNNNKMGPATMNNNGIINNTAQSTTHGNNNSNNPTPVHAGNPLLDLLAQQMWGQQSLPLANNIGAGINPMLTQLLLANVLQNAGGGFNALVHNNLNNQQPQQIHTNASSNNSNTSITNPSMVNNMQGTTQTTHNVGMTLHSQQQQQGVDADDGTNCGDSQQSNLASLLQQMIPNGALPNPLMNQAAGSSGGLASILQALGQQSQQQPQNRMPLPSQMGNSNDPTNLSMGNYQNAASGTAALGDM